MRKWLAVVAVSGCFSLGVNAADYTSYIEAYGKLASVSEGAVRLNPSTAQELLAAGSAEAKFLKEKIAFFPAQREKKIGVYFLHPKACYFRELKVYRKPKLRPSTNEKAVLLEAAHPLEGSNVPLHVSLFQYYSSQSELGNALLAVELFENWEDKLIPVFQYNEQDLGQEITEDEAVKEVVKELDILIGNASTFLQDRVVGRYVAVAQKFRNDLLKTLEQSFELRQIEIAVIESEKTLPEIEESFLKEMEELRERAVQGLEAVLNLPNLPESTKEKAQKNLEEIKSLEASQVIEAASKLLEKNEKAQK